MTTQDTTPAILEVDNITCELMVTYTLGNLKALGNMKAWLTFTPFNSPLQPSAAGKHERMGARPGWHVRDPTTGKSKSVTASDIDWRRMCKEIAEESNTQIDKTTITLHGLPLWKSYGFELMSASQANKARGPGKSPFSQGRKGTGIEQGSPTPTPSSRKLPQPATHSTIANEFGSPSNLDLKRARFSDPNATSGSQPPYVRKATAPYANPRELWAGEAEAALLRFSDTSLELSSQDVVNIQAAAAKDHKRGFIPAFSLINEAFAFAKQNKCQPQECPRWVAFANASGQTEDEVAAATNKSARMAVDELEEIPGLNWELMERLFESELAKRGLK